MNCQTFDMGELSFGKWVRIESNATEHGQDHGWYAGVWMYGNVWHFNYCQQLNGWIMGLINQRSKPCGNLTWIASGKSKTFDMG